MRTLIITFLLFFSLSSFAQEGWNNVAPAGTNPGFLGLDVIDTENVWVVGEGGIMLNTSDEGLTWNNISCPVNYNLTHVDFVNTDTGLVGGHGDANTEILKTTNGGSLWELDSIYSETWDVFDIEFVKGGLGELSRSYVTAGLSYVWKTDDYGENWVVTSIVNGCGASSVQSICFINKDEGWLVGEPASSTGVSIIHTTDGGDTYEIQTNPTNPDFKLNCVSFADNMHGFAVGVNGTIIFTSDGGQNWELRKFNSYSYHRWQSVHVNQSGQVWAVGQNGIIAYSTDWGTTWAVQESGVSCELWEVIFINDNEGWIVGGGVGQPGVILHTINGGVTGVNEKNVVTQFELYQNYPNPFNPATTIKYSVPRTENVVIKLFDVLGSEVLALLNEEKPAGTYEITWNASGSCRIPSGVYFYQLTAGSFIGTKKMILLK